MKPCEEFWLFHTHVDICFWNSNNAILRKNKSYFNIIQELFYYLIIIFFPYGTNLSIWTIFWGWQSASTLVLCVFICQKSGLHEGIDEEQTHQIQMFNYWWGLSSKMLQNCNWSWQCATVCRFAPSVWGTFCMSSSKQMCKNESKQNKQANSANSKDISFGNDYWLLNCSLTLTGCIQHVTQSQRLIWVISMLSADINNMTSMIMPLSARV